MCCVVFEAWRLALLFVEFLASDLIYGPTDKKSEDDTCKKMRRGKNPGMTPVKNASRRRSGDDTCKKKGGAGRFEKPAMSPAKRRADAWMRRDIYLIFNQVFFSPSKSSLNRQRDAIHIHRFRGYFRASSRALRYYNIGKFPAYSSFRNFLRGSRRW